MSERCTVKLSPSGEIAVALGEESPVLVRVGEPVAASSVSVIHADMTTVETTIESFPVDVSLGAQQVISVEPAVETPPIAVSMATRGPQGAAGPVGSSGVTFAQDFEPLGADLRDKQTWWNPITKQLRVYKTGTWQPVSPDGGHF